MSTSAIFRNLQTLSERMVELAHAQEWDALADAEKERSLLATQLPADLSGSKPSEAKAIAECIERILECNRDIQSQVEPWMEHTRGLLAALAPKA